MPEWGWIVVAGLILAILTPPILGMIRYTRDAVATAIAKSLAVALVDELVIHINGKLGLTELKDEVGEMRVQVTNLEGQIETLLVDDAE